MPIILIILGIFFVILGVNNTQSTFLSLLKGDFTGKGNFVYFFVAIFVVGAIGFLQPLKKFSDGFLLLIILVIFISNDRNGSGGFFVKFQQALQGS